MVLIYQKLDYDENEYYGIHPFLFFCFFPCFAVSTNQFHITIYKTGNSSNSYNMQIFKLIHICLVPDTNSTRCQHLRLKSINNKTDTTFRTTTRRYRLIASNKFYTLLLKLQHIIFVVMFVNQAWVCEHRIVLCIAF